MLLGVNMQTSFMHPPFGFALFYLRSVAPAKDYLDKHHEKVTTGVTTGQIYWGAVPFVIIQVIMVGLVIAFPQMVMVYKAGDKEYDRSTKIQIDRAAERIGSQPASTAPQQDDRHATGAGACIGAGDAPERERRPSDARRQSLEDAERGRRTGDAASAQRRSTADAT